MAVLKRVEESIVCLKESNSGIGKHEIETYKDDITLALYSIAISVTKGLQVNDWFQVQVGDCWGTCPWTQSMYSNIVMGKVVSIGPPSNLGSHNVLLETNYDLWAKRSFGPTANIRWTYRVAHQTDWISFLGLDYLSPL